MQSLVIKSNVHVTRFRIQSKQYNVSIEMVFENYHWTFSKKSFMNIIIIIFILKTLRRISFNKWDCPLEIKIIDLKYFQLFSAGLLGCRTIGVSEQWGVGLLGCWIHGAAPFHFFHLASCHCRGWSRHVFANLWKYNFYIFS